MQDWTIEIQSNYNDLRLQATIYDNWIPISIAFDRQ